jgi:hypothetical protein
MRGVLAGLMLGSAVIALPAGAQSGASASLTHTVSVTVPPRVKVQVAALPFSSTHVPATATTSQMNVGGLALTINASQAWVLSVGSAATPSAQESQLQWSPNGSSDFSKVTVTGAAVASGVTGYEPKAANLFFRDVASGGSDSAEPVVLTITAP